MEEKRLYIYQNIFKIKDHSNLLNIINTSNCKYTKNDNGMFINLNTLDDNIINNIYFLIFNEINSDINEINYETNITNLNTTITNNNKNIKKIKFKGISLNEFNEEEINIINLSKCYKI